METFCSTNLCLNYLPSFLTQSYFVRWILLIRKRTFVFVRQLYITVFVFVCPRQFWSRVDASNRTTRSFFNLSIAIQTEIQPIQGAFVWDQSGIRIIRIMRVSVCLGAILIPEYLDFYSGYSAPTWTRPQHKKEHKKTKLKSNVSSVFITFRKESPGKVKCRCERNKNN